MKAYLLLSIFEGEIIICNYLQYDIIMAQKNTKIKKKMNLEGRRFNVHYYVLACSRIWPLWADVHSVLLLKFIEHCNHPCSPLCAVLEENLLVSKAVMCRRIYCSPFHMTFYVSWGELYFFKCFFLLLLLFCAIALAVNSCCALQTGSPCNCSPGYVLAPSVMNAVCFVLCLW